MDEGSGGLTDAYAELQRARAFDVKAHERLMAVVATLGEASVLPAHDHRKLFSADADLHVMLTEGLSSGAILQPTLGRDTSTQAHSLAGRLREIST